ncbi:SLOG family protein [Dysgonomonas macrotermitis]|uniref:Uncharacterized SPBc2 prophage-derived protein YoqJ n=1 Tax=Dysgonomonas macrotermitis TaxID=1346286 RepID=A0A1M5HXJ8_9BACT|nr:SLOG family protein [Dysgonomonas macrotermitis]SHG20583.1 Uncharacterized SPBc2 prophage-derived protein YoqJ [Dysgonomonas macrotermitis]
MKNIEFDKQKTIAFTGHRNMDCNPVLLKEELIHIIREQYHIGYATFITGCAIGFDILAAEVVLELQKEYIGIQLFCAVPHAGHHLYFSNEDRQRYIRIADKATSNILLSSQYYDGCFLRRNDYMIANCSLLIAYYNSPQRSGTAYTVRRAQANNIPIINLYK